MKRSFEDLPPLRVLFQRSRPTSPKAWNSVSSTSARPPGPAKGTWESGSWPGTEKTFPPRRTIKSQKLKERRRRKEGGAAFSATTPTTGSLARSLARPHISTFCSRFHRRHWRWQWPRQFLNISKRPSIPCLDEARLLMCFDVKIGQWPPEREHSQTFVYIVIVTQSNKKGIYVRGIV